MKNTERVGIVTMLQQRIVDVEMKVDRPVVERPLWQRILLPMAGLAIFLIGFVMFFTPIPLAFLMIAGFPLLFCFHPRVEAWSRRKMHGWLDRIYGVVGSFRRAKRVASNSKS